MVALSTQFNFNIITDQRQICTKNERESKKFSWGIHISEVFKIFGHFQHQNNRHGKLAEGDEAPKCLPGVAIMEVVVASEELGIDPPAPQASGWISLGTMATKFDHKHPLAEKHDHANDESTNNQTDQEQDGEEVANRPQIHGSKKRFESQEHGEENLDFRWT